MTYLNKRCFWCFIIVVCLLVVDVFGQSFFNQGVYDGKKMFFLFKNFPVENMDKINCVMLEKQVRPASWPDRIPFGLCIDKKNKKIHYLYYGSFFTKEVRTIELGSESSPEDVSVDKKGFFYVTDSKINKVFCYRLQKDLKKVELENEIYVEKPSCIEVGPKDRLYVLSGKNQMVVFDKKDDKYTRLPKVESELRKTLKDKEIQDISISKKYINILVGAELFVFNRVGRLVLHKGLKRKKGYGALENTIYGDVLVLNSDFKIIEKYSKQLEYLTEYDFSNDFKAVALDMTVYDSYGYVAICSNTKGIYYGLGVQVDDLKFFRRKNNKYSEVNLKITFPSFVDITILDKNKREIKKVSNRRPMKSGSHVVVCRGLSLDSVGYAKIEVEPRYSIVNKVTKTISFLQVN
jgi:hypothetical protein